MGSWLCEVLVMANAFVRSIDNLSTGLMENISHLRRSRNFTFRKLDATHPEDLETEKYDVIFHLASRASPEEYQQHPIETLTANSLSFWIRPRRIRLLRRLHKVLEDTRALI
jgi:UDP-glucuronate decarboxylase